MLTSLTVMLLFAAPMKIASTGFTVSGEDQGRASVWLERFAEVMRRDKRVEITTPADLAQILGMERQRELLGCAEAATSCIAELASALGAEAVLVGTITRSEDSYLVVVRVLRQNSGKVLWSASGRMKGEVALLDWLDAQAAAAVDELVPRAPLPVGPLVVGGAGLVAAGVGATLLALSNTVAVDAVRAAPNEPALASALESGRSQGTAGVVLLGAGGAAIATSVVWLLVRGSPSPTMALVPVPGGAVASVGGRW